MYFDGDFVLFLTYKTHMNAMAFSKLTGCFDRDEDDDSPRRPLKALGQSFRYVFVPLKDAARDLIPASIMQDQTDQDWNGGISPISGQPMPPYVKEYPVVEVYCNPVSVCMYTQEVLHEHLYMKRVNLEIDLRPWTDCLFGLTMRWGWHSYARAPQWFVETDERNDLYDEDLTASEATGYCPLPRPSESSKGQYSDGASSSNTVSSSNRNRVLEWAKGVPHRAFIQRPARLETKSIDPKGFQFSPCRKVKSAKPSKSEGKVPSWTKRNGHFPTHAFACNDWAMFFYGTRLSEDDDGYTD